MSCVRSSKHISSNRQLYPFLLSQFRSYGIRWMRSFFGEFTYDSIHKLMHCSKMKYSKILNILRQPYVEDMITVSCIYQTHKKICANLTYFDSFPSSMVLCYFIALSKEINGFYRALLSWKFLKENVE